MNGHNLKTMVFSQLLVTVPWGDSALVNVSRALSSARFFKEQSVTCAWIASRDPGSGGLVTFLAIIVPVHM